MQLDRFDKQILEILKNDKPIDACINVYSPYHIHIYSLF